MRRKRVDPLVVIVAVGILALGLYAGVLPGAQIIAPAGAVFELDISGDLWFNFTVQGTGGHLQGAYTSTNQTEAWIHPISSWGVLPKGPAYGTCSGRLDAVLPPGSYVITFFLGPAVVRITESFRVTPARAPGGANQFAASWGPPCPGYPS